MFGWNSVARLYWRFRRSAQSTFDGHGYLLANPDVAAEGHDPWRHYILHGKAEGRRFVSKCDLGTVNTYTKFLSSGYFDPEWYLSVYPDVRHSGKNPLQHFCENGVWEGRDPGPEFSTSWYLEQYPDVRGMNPFIHFIDHGIKEGRTPKPPKGALKTAEETFNSILDLDPELCGREEFYFFKGVEFVDGRQKLNRLKPILRHLIDAIPAETRHFLFVPWLRHSGGDLVAVNVVRAAVEEYGASDLTLIVADYDVIEAQEWLPDGVTILSIPALAAELTLAEKAELIELLLRVVRPAGILNVNSHACWHAIRHYGHVLRQYTEMYAYVFCRDYTERGAPAGYSDTYLPRTISFIKGIYSDNASFIDELSEQHGLVESDRLKIKVLKQPVKLRRHWRSGRTQASKTLSVLWASRIARQKNWPLLAKIIALSPKKFHFHIWGYGAEAETNQLQAQLAGRPNVTLHGQYDSFDNLPLDDYDVFLYTSLWDGIPNVILEAATYGFPVIAPKVGGIPEVINNLNAWPIESDADADVYVAALVEIQQDLKAANQKANELTALVQQEHSWENYKSRITSDDEFLSPAR